MLCKCDRSAISDLDSSLSDSFSELARKIILLALLDHYFLYFFILEESSEECNSEYLTSCIDISPSSPEHFSRKYFPKRGLLYPLTIINMEGHITLNLLPLYSYGCPLSIDSKISIIY